MIKTLTCDIRYMRIFTDGSSDGL